tara:strand:- start:101 stop:406 length:306 start_codon:yes stop_codon:yes gene_type:complete
MLKKILIIISMMTLVQGCQTVQNKTNDLVEKEEKYLEKFMNKKIKKVFEEFGEPTQYLTPDPESGGGKLIYNTKKLGIKCVRTFEVDETERVVGFSSKGCF